MPQALPIGALSASCIKEFARAKINLTLRVLGRLSDGYHELESLTVFANVGDTLIVNLDEASSVSVTGRFATELSGENILDKTLALLRSTGPGLRLGSVKLEKRLPVASGVGGGSADAAALLRAIKRGNPSVATDFDWLAAAAQLGADVPVCLMSTASIMRGKGDSLNSNIAVPPLNAVLANAREPVSASKTADVFKRLDAPPLVGRPITTTVPYFHGRDNLIAYMQEHSNDLTAPAIAVMPEISDVLSSLKATPGCVYAALSGAGPTCFGIFDQAEAAAETLREAHPAWWIEPVTLS